MHHCPGTAEAGVLAERTTRPDAFGLPSGVSLATCIHATRHQGKDVGILLHHLEHKVQGNLNRRLIPAEWGNLWDILNFTAGVQRDMGQQLFVLGMALEHSMARGEINQPVRYDRYAIVSIIWAATLWDLEDDMFYEARRIYLLLYVKLGFVTIYEFSIIFRLLSRCIH